jgi:hypothetical protein
MTNTPETESDMYKSVCEWLISLLQPRYKSFKVNAYDTSSVALYRWLERMNLQDYFPEYLGFDIRVDITGVIHNDSIAHLAFVECKLQTISLRDISQLLGYCRVAQPKCAFIISPEGISDHVAYLLKTYQRYDVLDYNEAARIHVATWNHDRKEIDMSNILPPGHFVL